MNATLINKLPRRNEYGSYNYRGLTIYREGNARCFTVRYGRDIAGVNYERSFKSLSDACVFIDKRTDAKSKENEVMKTYGIYVYEAKPATYDEHDGFGDYVNYGARRICEVGATSEEHALEVAGFSDNYHQLFWAKLVD